MPLIISILCKLLLRFTHYVYLLFTKMWMNFERPVAALEYSTFVLVYLPIQAPNLQDVEFLT